MSSFTDDCLIPRVWVCGFQFVNKLILKHFLTTVVKTNNEIALAIYDMIKIKKW